MQTVNADQVWQIESSYHNYSVRPNMEGKMPVNDQVITGKVFGQMSCDANPLLR
jgi:hypothetical protein